MKERKGILEQKGEKGVKGATRGAVTVSGKPWALVKKKKRIGDIYPNFPKKRVECGRKEPYVLAVKGKT